MIFPDHLEFENSLMRTKSLAFEKSLVFILVVLFFFFLPCPGAQSEPDVRVDPRVELMSVIFRLAGNPEYNQSRLTSYIQDVEEHFACVNFYPA